MDPKDRQELVKMLREYANEIENGEWDSVTIIIRARSYGVAAEPAQSESKAEP